QLRLYWNGGQPDFRGTTNLRDDTWHHVAFVRDKAANALSLYLDGRLEASTPTAGTDITLGTLHKIGGDNRASGMPYFHGLMDDLQIYTRALSKEGIAAVMRGVVDYRMSSAPQPADQAVDVWRDVVLSWSPGRYAATHDVYLGTDPMAVGDANRVTSLGVLVSQGQADPTGHPGRLAFGQTYYWRVDEVNAAPGAAIFRGSVWSFTVEPVAYTLPRGSIQAVASSSSSAEEGPVRTIDGSGLDSADLHSARKGDMWLSSPVPAGTSAWIRYEFDKVYALHQMLVWNHNSELEPLVGLGIKQALIEYSTDGAAWKTLGTSHEFARAAGQTGSAVNATVDFAGAAARHVRITAVSNWGGVLPQYGLSEVRFLYLPMLARTPSPVSGAAGVAPQQILSWRPGRQAARHDLYLSTDQQKVIAETAPVRAVSAPGFDTGALRLGQTYYWKVNEVNDAAPTRVWPGDLWSLSTQEYLVVDDFEAYTNDEGSRIYETWIDGWENKTGAQVGYLEAPFAERTIVHEGRQSLPLTYTNANAPFYSETERTFDVPQDWTLYGISTLTIHFRGATGNQGKLYLKIDTTKVSYPGDAADIAKVIWQPWNVDLSTLGGNLKSVRSLKIGIEGANATGVLYLDDIRLYPKAPAVLVPLEPDPKNLQAWWTLNEVSGTVARDESGHGQDGTIAGNPQWGTRHAGRRPGVRWRRRSDYAEVTATRRLFLRQRGRVGQDPPHRRRRPDRHREGRGPAGQLSGQPERQLGVWCRGPDASVLERRPDQHVWQDRLARRHVAPRRLGTGQGGECQLHVHRWTAGGCHPNRRDGRHLRYPSHDRRRQPGDGRTVLPWGRG
ncbi:MAG: LamG domain-containing protein, partial [Planctomycetes bacterium]|nr:LamG domain-containing protein [Planctomycetota bacterium]